MIQENKKVEVEINKEDLTTNLQHMHQPAQPSCLWPEIECELVRQ